MCFIEYERYEARFVRKALNVHVENWEIAKCRVVKKRTENPFLTFFISVTPGEHAGGGRNCENRTIHRRCEFSEVVRSFCTRSSVKTISSADKTVHYFDLSPTTDAHGRNWYGRRTAVNCVSWTATVHGDRPRTGIKWIVCEADGEMKVFNFVLGPAERLCALHTSSPTTDAPGEMWRKKHSRQSDGGLHTVLQYLLSFRDTSTRFCISRSFERFTRMHIKERKKISTEQRRK